MNVLVNGLGQGTRLYRAVTGDHWTTTDHLLALVADRLAILVWQPTEQGAKGKNFPKPLLRPGQEPAAEPQDADGKTFGSKGMTVADIDATFARIYEKTQKKPRKRATKQKGG